MGYVVNSRCIIVYKMEVLLYRCTIKKHGCHREISSYEGLHFESALFQKLYKYMEINKTRTTPLHPSADDS